MALADRLAAGHFVITAEFGPPADPDPALVTGAAATLTRVVDAANVTDNPAASVKMSPLAAAALMLQAGLEPILQVTARDRNVLALQSDLLGAWALGVRSVLALSGDPLLVGRYDGRATHVRDVDSLGLTKLIASLNAGLLLDGQPLAVPTRFLIAAAANPLLDPPQRLETKLAAGATLLQTNIVYDVGRFHRWFEQLAAAGIPERAHVLVGVAPPRSTNMLRFLHEKIPGVEVDDATFARMDGLQGEHAQAEGVAIAADVIAAVRDVPGVAGVHVMAPGWEVEAVPRVVAAAAPKAELQLPRTST
jgi:methylenetetrahydrofolate reductase (NADPH)